MIGSGSSSVVLIVLTIALVAVGPIAAAYGTAFLLSQSFEAALPAALSGGLDGLPAAASTVVYAIAFGISAGAALPTVLDMDWLVGAPAGRLWSVVNPDVGARAGRRLGWFGPLIGSAVVLGLGVEQWPAIDAGSLQRLVAGAGIPADWLTVLVPAFIRSTAGVIAAVIGGAIWSITLGDEDSD